ncbi:hypothetical protein GIY62_14700 [Burkholderia plantarii]|uniref:hypothetical protein n=1 Tax=Burkholderia plantarii TaxID=41899 RepID=UPI00272DAAD0|nr:hypothetical protein [Burkholderia plantarii]WLE58376.1 hypothetical protein GIY62_14700 [Burkholderia plantarii]
MIPPEPSTSTSTFTTGASPAPDVDEEEAPRFGESAPDCEAGESHELIEMFCAEPVELYPIPLLVSAGNVDVELAQQLAAVCDSPNSVAPPSCASPIELPGVDPLVDDETVLVDVEVGSDAPEAQIDGEPDRESGVAGSGDLGGKPFDELADSPAAAPPAPCASALDGLGATFKLDDAADAPVTAVVSGTWSADGWLEANPAVCICSPGVAGASCAVLTPGDVAWSALVVALGC